MTVTLELSLGRAKALLDVAELPAYIEDMLRREVTRQEALNATARTVVRKSRYRGTDGYTVSLSHDHGGQWGRLGADSCWVPSREVAEQVRAIYLRGDRPTADELGRVVA